MNARSSAVCKDTSVHLQARRSDPYRVNDAHFASRTIHHSQTRRGANHVDLERKTQAYSQEHRTLLCIPSWRLLTLPTTRTRNLVHPIRQRCRHGRRREAGEECLQQERWDSFPVLVLPRIMHVVGVLTEAEAAAAVGLLNGQRWVCRQEMKGNEGKEQLTS
jgi:hypothetical protein